ncbi:MAG TPA: M23 family metallopeptidase [Candidatus Dojkabacteria bacterium]|nr:M23 family metallopeptidase [Candidatus Dojkabacteria bacterium]
MGLLSNLADNLLPRQRRGRGGGGRPLIDVPEFYASDVGYVGATMNAITAVPEGAMKNVMGNVTIGLYSTGGFNVNIGGAYNVPVLSVQGIADTLNDPNAAAHSAADYVGRTIGGRKGNFWTSTSRWSRMMNGFGERYAKSMIKSSSALSQDEKNGLLEALNADVTRIPDSLREEGRRAYANVVASEFKKYGADDASASALGNMLNNMDSTGLRQKIYRKAKIAGGRSGYYNRGKRVADVLASEASSTSSMQALLKTSKGAELGGVVEQFLDASDNDLITMAYKERLARLESKGGDSKKIAIKLKELLDNGGLSAGSFDVGKYNLSPLAIVNGIRELLLIGSYSKSFKNNILNGNALLWFDLGKSSNDQGKSMARWFSGLVSDPKFKEMNISGKAGFLFLFHPGSIARMFWDGDWFKVLEAQLKAGKLLDPNKEISKFLKKGIKGNINDFRDRLLREVGLKELLLKLEQLNPELAKKVQNVFKIGLDEYARSWAKGAVKIAFKKAGESVAKLLTKFGLKKLGQWLGTVLLPGIGSILGWIVGELVWTVVDSFMWKLLEIVIQLLFLVIAIIIIIIMFVCGIFMESQNMFPVMLLPGQDLTTHNPRGGEEDVGGDEYLGPGVPFDYTKIESGGILNNQVCTQGYFGNSSDPVCNWSHCNLVAKEGKYAIDVSGSTDNTAYSPVNGTVSRIIKNYESLDRIEIQGDGITFYMIHIDADTCRVAKGDTVSKGEALCKLYGNDGNVDVKCPNSNNICWTGPHIHIYATNEAGLGVSNLHEIIKIDANLCDTSNN